MTKKQIENKMNDLYKQYKELEKQLAEMPQELKLKDYNKPFYKWTIAEQNDLMLISEKAFKWFINEEENNREKTIYDYNAVMYGIDKIPLAD